MSLKIFGVGSAGTSVLEELARRDLPGASCSTVGTRADCLGSSSAGEKICLEAKSLRGSGAGGEPGRGCAAAEEDLLRLKAACQGVDVIFIVAGLGGTTGTGIAPILARVAGEIGAPVLAFVTLPFDWEGNRRHQRAQRGLTELKAAADGVICLPSQRVFKLIDETTSVAATFKMMNELLADAVTGVWRLLARKGLIEIHCADLCVMLRDRHGESSFATAEAAGPTRSREVVDRLLAHPMLDGGAVLTDSDAVLVSLIGGPDLTMVEVNRVMENINGKCQRAQVMMGAAIDESFRDRLAITVIATRCQESPVAQPEFDDAAHAEAARAVEDLETQLLNRSATPRPQSRFVPPPPSLTPEKMEQLMAKQAPGPARSRKSAPRMRQGQLPLEIVSKGRFDKSEPTIHRGEDLDVPTYIRRGVALN